jgi:hypothetical protein
MVCDGGGEGRERHGKGGAAAGRAGVRARRRGPNTATGGRRRVGRRYEEEGGRGRLRQQHLVAEE